MERGLEKVKFGKADSGMAITDEIQQLSIQQTNIIREYKQEVAKLKASVQKLTAENAGGSGQKDKMSPFKAIRNLSNFVDVLFQLVEDVTKEVDQIFYSSP